MNVFSNFASAIARGRPFTNNPLYIQEYEFPSDISYGGGTGFIDYSNNAIYHPNAHSLEEGTFSIFQNDANTSSINIDTVMERRGEFTLMCKYRVGDGVSSSVPLFGFENPYYELNVDKTSVQHGDNVSFTILKVSPEDISYSITGVTSVDLSNAPLTGVISNVETILTYPVLSGMGSMIFTLEGLGMNKTVSLPTYNVQCLSQTTNNSVRMANPYTFNNVTYDSNKKIGVSIGTYTLTGVTTSHPIGFVINDTTKFEVTSGTTYLSPKTVEGISVQHYTGTIVFEVKQDFGIISYNCYLHGYMGGKDKLIFSNICT